MCLLLTGQFETAIDLLNQIEQFRCHAVHIGIYLHECRLLSTASKSDSPMCKFHINRLSIMIILSLVLRVLFPKNT